MYFSLTLELYTALFEKTASNHSRSIAGSCFRTQIVQDSSLLPKDLITTGVVIFYSRKPVWVSFHPQCGQFIRWDQPSVVALVSGYLTNKLILYRHHKNRNCQLRFFCSICLEQQSFIPILTLLTRTPLNLFFDCVRLACVKHTAMCDHPEPESNPHYSLSFHL